MRNVYPEIPLDTTPAHLYDYGGEFKDYLKLKSPLENPINFFNDYVIVSPLYRDRGRADFHEKIVSGMGISIVQEDRCVFPSMETSWMPDCLNQEAQLDSAYVQFLARREIPYVAGPSGMTSLFAANMVFLGDFSTKEEYEYYIMATMAFITGGGLHSIHEVLSVINIRLGLLEHYRTDDEKAGNYHSFFSLFSEDKIIQNNIDAAWNETINWLKINFSHLIDIKLPLEITDKPPLEITESSQPPTPKCF